MPCDLEAVQMTPAVPDKRSAVQVNETAADTPVTLNVGDTTVDVTATSPDGSKTQVRFCCCFGFKIFICVNRLVVLVGRGFL